MPRFAYDPTTWPQERVDALAKSWAEFTVAELSLSDAHRALFVTLTAAPQLVEASRGGRRSTWIQPSVLEQLTRRWLRRPRPLGDPIEADWPTGWRVDVSDRGPREAAVLRAVGFIERQKNGNPHVHMLCSARRLDRLRWLPWAAHWRRTVGLVRILVPTDVVGLAAALYSSAEYAAKAGDDADPFIAL